MKKLFPILLLFIFCSIFFYPTFTKGYIPAPTDTLIGLYHPWLDLYATVSPSGVTYRNFLITDPIRQQIPWRKLVIDNLKSGKIFNWNPYSFAGAPLTGNIQAGTFYPLNILFFFLPFMIAWSVLIIFQPLLAAFFLYLFLRHKNISPWVSLGAGLAWAFCGFSIAWLTWGTIMQTALWLPLILLAIDEITKEIKIFWFIVLVLSLTFAFFAGHAQVALYIFLFTGVYALLKKSWWVLVAVLMTLVCSSIQWIPFLSTLWQSSRVVDVNVWLKDGWFLPWQNLAQFLAPDFFGNPATLNYWGIWNYGEFIGYIGVLPLLMALYAIIARKDRFTRFCGIGAFIVFLFLLPTPLAKIPYQWHIPFWSTLQPTRLMVLVDFLLVTLAALGLNEYVRKPQKKILVPVGFVGVGLASLWFFAFHLNNAVTKHNLILPSILFGVSIIVVSMIGLIPKKWRNVTLFFTVCFICFDLFRFGWKFTPFTPSEYFFPKTQVISFLQNQPKPFRVMSLDNRAIPPNVTAFYGIETPEGYDPVYDARYEEFIAALNRNAPNITPPFGFNRIITLSNVDSPLLPLLNVKYVLALDTIQNKNLTLVDQEQSTRVYVYTKALPRIYPVEKIIVKHSKQDAMNMLYDPGFVPGKTAVVESNTPISFHQMLPTDSLYITTQTDSSLIAVSQLSQEHFVVIANAFNAGWHAWIDGKETPIYRTDYVFQGIVVSQGNHTIVLEFKG